MKDKYINWTARDHLAYFKSKDKTPKRDKWQIIREVGKSYLTAEAQLRLEWIIFYHTVSQGNASHTANHFGISRKTFHKWLFRFDETKLQTLEDQSRRPHKLRTWTITPIEQDRVTKIRKAHMKWGKNKLKKIYQDEYGETISAWKIERVIREFKLFPDKQKHEKQVQKRRRRKNPKRLIYKMKVKDIKPGRLWHTDAIILYWYGIRRVIFTAIEHHSKLGFARVYNTNSSKNAADFLKRLVYISDGDIKVIHSDNGSEFAGKFEQACRQMTIAQVYSRVRNPKDNAALERFNRTVQDECLEMSDVDLSDIKLSNLNLLDWLIEYNDFRPHESLDYQTPIAYAQQNYFDKVLPMWSACTIY
jgi:transposase InsO family protein